MKKGGMMNPNPYPAGRQHSPPLTPPDAVRTMVAWFPKADPDPAWTTEAIRTLESCSPELLAKVLHIGRSSRPKALPSIPTLYGWTEEASAQQTPTRSGRSLPSPEELSRRAADLCRAWIRNNGDFLAQLADHGYPLGWKQDLHQAAWFGAQREPAMMDEPEINCMELPAFPPKPLSSTVLMFGQIITIP
jgi:hypothetical protein